MSTPCASLVPGPPACAPRLQARPRSRSRLWGRAACVPAGSGWWSSAAGIPAALHGTAAMMEGRGTRTRSAAECNAALEESRRQPGDTTWSRTSFAGAGSLPTAGVAGRRSGRRYRLAGPQASPQSAQAGRRAPALEAASCPGPRRRRPSPRPARAGPPPPKWGRGRPPPLPTRPLSWPW